MESVLHAHDRILSQPVDPRRFFLVSTRPQRPPASAPAVAADSAEGLAASTVGIRSRRGLCHDGAEQPAPGAALLGTRGGHGAARDVAAGAERREHSAAEQAQLDLCGQSRLTATGRTDGAERAGESRGGQQSAEPTAEAWPGVARSCGDDDAGARKKRKSFCSAEPFSLPALLLPRPRNDSNSACLTSATPPPQRRQRLPSVRSSAAAATAAASTCTTIRQSRPMADVVPARPETPPLSRNPAQVSPDLRHSPCSHPLSQPLQSPQLAASPSRLPRVSTPQTTLHLATATVPHNPPTAPTTPNYLTASHRRHDYDVPARNPFGSAELPRKLVIPPLRPPQVRYSRPSSAVSSSWDVPPFSTKRQCLPARIEGAHGGSARVRALGWGTSAGNGEGMGECVEEEAEKSGVDGSALGVTWGECDGRNARREEGAGEAEGEGEGMVGMMIRIGECMGGSGNLGLVSGSVGNGMDSCESSQEWVCRSQSQEECQHCHQHMRQQLQQQQQQQHPLQQKHPFVSNRCSSGSSNSSSNRRVSSALGSSGTTEAGGKKAAETPAGGSSAAEAAASAKMRRGCCVRMGTGGCGEVNAGGAAAAAAVLGNVSCSARGEQPHRRAHQHNLCANSPSKFSLTSRSSSRQRRGSRAAPVTVSASAQQQQQQQQQERAREAKEVAMDNGMVEGPAVRVLGSVMTDETVPEGHQGLHGFLYGSQGADVHDAPSQSYALQQGEDDGSLQLPLSDYVARRETLKLAGIYAVYDAAGALQYVGFSRSVVLALKGHAAFVGAERASSVRVRVYSDAAMITRARLEEERQKWIPQLMVLSGAADSQKLPPGNSADLAEWEGPSGPGTAAMSAAEVAEYEEKKLKLRKAMGENLADAVEDETDDARTRRLNLLRATEGDDWSSVIDRQTASTLPTDGPAAVASAPAAATDSSADTIVSPFARGAGSKGGVKEEVEMTVAAVDAALEAVRPYLIADGGNVEVAGITDGVVSVRLQGACGTCPSSTSTMKMGIEAELQRCFPTQLKEVVQVDVIDTSVTVAVSNARCGGVVGHLDSRHAAAGRQWVWSASAGGPLAAWMYFCSFARTHLPAPSLLPPSPSFPQQAVDGHLDMLRPAISGFGGRVQVVEVNEAEGTCRVAYEGPPTVAMGIQAAIKDKFPTLKTVDVVGFA
ncbi:unnamed protein product [Closterium sp. NIES-54]